MTVKFIILENGLFQQFLINFNNGYKIKIVINVEFFKDRD